MKTNGMGGENFIRPTALMGPLYRFVVLLSPIAIFMPVGWESNCLYLALLNVQGHRIVADYWTVVMLPSI